MIVPGPWPAAVLTLATFRVLRLVAWDTFPWIANARARLLGQEVVQVGTASSFMGVTNDGATFEYRYGHPVLAELFHCAFCLGLWLSGVVYVLWLYLPTVTMYAAAPLALSAVVGLIAKNLDP